jgi:hypothetical protein
MCYNEIKYTLYIHIRVHLSLMSSECQVHLRRLRRPYTVSIPYLAVTHVLYCFHRPSRRPRCFTGMVVGKNITVVLSCNVTSLLRCHNGNQDLEISHIQTTNALYWNVTWIYRYYIYIQHTISYSYI